MTNPATAWPRARKALSIIFGCKPNGAVTTVRSATPRPLLPDTSSSALGDSSVDRNEPVACTLRARFTWVQGIRRYTMGNHYQPRPGSVPASTGSHNIDRDLWWVSRREIRQSSNPTRRERCWSVLHSRACYSSKLPWLADKSLRCTVAALPQRNASDRAIWILDPVGRLRELKKPYRMRRSQPFELE